jgi:hypothetical protein
MYSSSLTCILNNTMSRTAGAIILLISHGYEVKETNDPFVELANQATEQFSIATAPGGFLVDLIPASVCPLFFNVELTHSLPFSPAFTRMVPGRRVQEESETLVVNPP